MSFSIRRMAAAFACAAVALICSCEMHHVGELSQPAEDQTHPVASSPAPGVSPTPAEFFPTSTPR